MSSSKSLAAYEDVQAVLDRALGSPMGVSIIFPVKGAAQHFRQRCYALRSLMREMSKKVYEIGHPLYGQSPYEGLTVKTPEEVDTGFKLVVIKGEMKTLIVEDLK